MYSTSLFHNPEPGDAVYIITDGGDNQSRSTEREVERELLSKNIRLFSFVLSGYAFPTEEELLGHSYIRHLTEVTGGVVIDAGLSQYRGRGHVKQLSASLQRTYDKIISFYELEVELPRKLETEHQWKLQVVDEFGKRRKDVEIEYAKTLPSCH